ncbi:aldo/keto reductase (plasmid) [Skermanella sp. TT6]|uniref:Aldo/keto reductase n=1 Tax=Skermanella cutis TaxID=2775420 RepID=A0ABX7BEB3_9PROT|nr:aldo/keto reductase [Skermanella sp. TT6]QQP92754.1 aldo/keto reductase [Skermanella sp. TT6]
MHVPAPTFALASSASPILGLGCGRIGSILSDCSGRTAARFIDVAFDRGIRLFDTADIYGQGESERTLGTALSGKRGQVMLVTKAGQRFSEKDRIGSYLKPPLRWAAKHIPQVRAALSKRRSGALPRCYEPRYLVGALESSLRRLKTDHVDVFLLHSPGRDDLRDEQFAMLSEIRRRGLARQVGVSCDDAETATLSLDHPVTDVVQLPLYRGCANDMIMASGRARDLGKLVMAREILTSAGHRPLGEAPGRDAVRAAIDWTRTVRSIGAVLVGTTRLTHLEQIVEDWGVITPLDRGHAGQRS